MTNTLDTKIFFSEWVNRLSVLFSGEGFRKMLFISIAAVAVLLFCGHAMAGDAIGLARYQTETLKPQAAALWVILKVCAIILGVVFMIIGFVRLTKQQKDGAWVMIIVGGALASVTTLVMLTGETIAGQKLEKDATDILGQARK